jgi:putative FmdB family regulatory protein
MPRYEYECDNCREEILIFHSLDEKLDSCPNCTSENIKRSFKTPIAFSGKKEGVQKAGELVEEFIQESREELEREKKEIDKNR